MEGVPTQLERAQLLDLLRDGGVEVLGRLTDASNATFLCRVVAAETSEDPDAWPGDPPPISATCVYKPTRGERPLDDFPSGTLAKREVAAFVLSTATGWDIVPPTVLRDGPFGIGMVQAWIEADPDADVLQMAVRGDPRLRPMCIFDALANNADRKGGHLLPISSGTVYGVDHGICFAVEPKLRTVLWAWRGEPLEPRELRVVSRVRDALNGTLGQQLGELLAEREIEAIAGRARALLDSGRFPQPDPHRPAVPWPPF